MTLADFIRKYLEGRNKICEQKVRYLDLTNNFQYPHEYKNEKCFLHNTQYFSNNIDSNKKDQSAKSSQKNVITRQIGVSKTKRIVTLPDGTTQTETIIKDNNGNEEKHITHQKGDKKYTTIIRKDALGVEQFEQKVTDVKDNEKFEFETYFPNVYSDKSSENGFNFWFHKFFKPQERPSENWTHENTPFDYNASLKEEVESFIKGMNKIGETYKNNVSSNEPEKFNNGFIPGDFPKMNDSFFNEESRKFLENFEKEAMNFNQKFSRKKNGKNQMDTVIEKIFPRSQSMFEKFAENAMIDIPEEKTQLDRFIESDEEYQKELAKIYNEKKQIIKKLEDKFLRKSTDRNYVYSDINESNDTDLSEMFPNREPSFIPNVNEFGDILKTIDPKQFLGDKVQTKIYVQNGKRRIELIKKNAQNNIEKNITYKIGDKSYSIITIIDKYGSEVKRERHFNFPEDELNDFKNQWSKNFHSDFNEK